MEPLFEVVDSIPEDEPKVKTKKSKFDLDTRTTINWFKLPHHQGFCTVPLHDEIQELMSDERKEYRQRYPVRQLHAINGYDVCRDCFVASADIEASEKDMPPAEFASDDV